MTKVAVLAAVFIDNNSHRTLAESTIRSVKSSLPLELIAVINQLRPNTDDSDWVKANFDIVLENDRNILSRAWNKGIKLGFERGADYVLVINLDLLLAETCIDNLVRFARRSSRSRSLYRPLQ